MKQALLIVFAIVFCLLQFACTSEPSTTTVTVPSTVTESVTTTLIVPSPVTTTLITILPTSTQHSLDNQFFISVNLGDEFTIVLESRQYAGNDWIGRYDKTMFELVDQVFKPYYPITPGGQTIVGAGGKEEYHFKALKQGQDAIAFILWQRSTYEITEQVMYLIEVK